MLLKVQTPLSHRIAFVAFMDWQLELWSLPPPEVLALRRDLQPQ